MKLSNKEMSVGAQVFWGKIVWGILAIGISIVGCCTSLASKIFHYLLLMVVFAMVFVIRKVKLEEDDEMSTLNLIKAKAKSSDIMRNLYPSFAVLSAFAPLLLKNSNLSIYRILIYMFFFLLGIQDLLIGLFFRKLEAE